MKSRRLGVSSAYFDGRPDQVARIRDWSRGATGLEHADSVVLVVSELVTNAVRHTASGSPYGRVRVTVETLPGRIVLVSVTDDGPRAGHRTSLPRIPEQADDLRAGGRGLRLVHEVSEQWWWTGCAGSPLTVWALIDPQRDPHLV